MAADIILDKNSHDIDFSNGGKLHTNTADNLAQRIKIALLLRKTEWLPDQSIGVPYHQSFFNIKNNKGFIDSFLQGYILNIDGVQSLLSYSSTITVERTLQVTFKVKDKGGTITSVSTEV